MFDELYITEFKFRVISETEKYCVNVAFQTPNSITDVERLKMRKQAYINVLNKYEHELIKSIELKSEIIRHII